MSLQKRFRYLRIQKTASASYVLNSNFIIHINLLKLIHFYIKMAVQYKWTTIEIYIIP